MAGSGAVPEGPWIKLPCAGPAPTAAAIGMTWRLEEVLGMPSARLVSLAPSHEVPLAAELVPGAVQLGMPSAAELVPGALQLEMLSAGGLIPGALELEMPSAGELVSCVPELRVPSAGGLVPGALALRMPSAEQLTPGASELGMPSCLEAPTVFTPLTLMAASEAKGSGALGKGRHPSALEGRILGLRGAPGSSRSVDLSRVARWGCKGDGEDVGVSTASLTCPTVKEEEAGSSS